MAWARHDQSGLRSTVALVAILWISASPLSARADQDLTEFSLEELMDVDVTSVSRKAESRLGASAAVTVITAEDLRRGGFTSVPEALRTVPGVQVARIDASRWAISIRGFVQEFTNKLLVLIDGRSVYTPLFGGTVWNEQNIPIEDIDRIEVVRGPGGTLWGANAVNGVINIISKTASQTQGIRAHIFGGSHESGVAGRFGGEIGESTQFRLSVKGERIRDFDTDENFGASDSMGQLRAGLRIDSQLTERDELTVFFDYFDIDREAALGVTNPFFQIVDFNDQHFKQRGGNALLKYGHEFESGSRFELKTYYDRVSRRTTSEEDSHSFDIEAQHGFDLLDNVNVIWGGNYRFWTTDFEPGPGSIGIEPDEENFHLGGAFFQVQLDFFDDRLSLIAGTKLSVGNFSGFEYQPSGRAVLKPVDGHTIWAAVSRAVRTPTLIDRDVTGNLGPVQLEGDRNFRSEELVSIEAGYRFHELEWLVAEVSGFYSFYDDFSSLSLDPNPSPTGFPVFNFANDGDIRVRGLELELTVIPTDWMRIVSGYSVLGYDDDDLVRNLLSPGREETKNPQHQFSIRSFFDLPNNFEIDAALYYVDGIPAFTPTLGDENVEQYFRLDLRLGWRPVEWLAIALVGQNLADHRHIEFTDVQRNQSSRIPRSGYAKFTFDF